MKQRARCAGGTLKGGVAAQCKLSGLKPVLSKGLSKSSLL